MTDATYTTIEVERRGPVAVLSLARPEVKNAINLEMIEDVRAALRTLAGDEEISALVLTGKGPTFASGADIAELKARGREDALAGINSTLFAEVEAFPLPTVAAVEGWCLGGGLELALACDVRVASRGAKLGSPEVGLGIIPAAGALYRLPRVVGLSRAKELVFTARIVDAEEAHELGLVDDLAEEGAALDVALELAGKIAKQDRLALRLAKLALRSMNPPMPGMGMENMAQAVCFESAEKHRRMQAFLDRKAKKAAEKAAKEAGDA